MRSLKYCFKLASSNQEITESSLENGYLVKFKAKIEAQLKMVLAQIAEDEAEIELTLCGEGKKILHWQIVNWTPEGYDKLITFNII